MRNIAKDNRTPIKYFLNSYSNIEDWTIFYENNKNLPIKIYIKLSIYIYKDYGYIYDQIYNMGYSNIELYELKKRY